MDQQLENTDKVLLAIGVNPVNCIHSDFASKLEALFAPSEVPNPILQFTPEQKQALETFEKQRLNDELLSFTWSTTFKTPWDEDEEPEGEETRAEDQVSEGLSEDLINAP